MVAKEEIQRNQVHDNKMNIIIMRLDYVGVTDLAILLEKFDEKFPGLFQHRQEIYSNQLNVNLRAEDLNSISESISIPVNVIKKEKIVRYSGLPDSVCQVSLDISQYFLCMTITCDGNYDGLDNYSKHFEETAKLFKDDIPYFSPKRLGLRKNRVEDFESIAQLKEIFVSHLFCLDFFNSDCEIPLVKNYSDTLRNQCNKNIFVNINRNVLLLLQDNKDVYKTSLDIDAYYQNEEILNSHPVSALLNDANLYEFDIYKSCMTESYLNSII